MHRQSSAGTDFVPPRIIDDDRASIGKSPDRMRDIAWDDRNLARAGDLGHTVDRHLKFSLDHLIHFFLRMVVLVDGCVALELVVSERHAWRMEISSIPAGQALYDIKSAGVNERHTDDASKLTLPRPVGHGRESGTERFGK